MLTHEIGYIFLFAGIVSFVFKKLKQPIIPAYVLVGVLCGPMVFGLVGHANAIAELSEMAVVVMLFVIGMEMDLTRLKKVGSIAILGGILQVGVTWVLGFFVARLAGVSAVGAAYLGFALAFSSTMLVVKILGDKYEMDTLHGRIIVGILIVQDMAAIFALSILGTVDNFSVDTLLTTGTMAAGLILIVVFALGRWVFPRMLDYLASERELLFVIVIAILFATGFYAEHQRLSLGIGAFLAGLSLSRLSYRYEIIGDLKALKSFFTILFFASLGLQLTPINLDAHTVASTFSGFIETISQQAGFIIMYFVLAVIVKPFLVMFIVALFGYKSSTSFNSGLALGQLSEFSLVLIAQGITAQHIDASILPAIIVVTVFSMTVSSYLLKYNLVLYRLVGNRFSFLERLALAKRDLTEIKLPPSDGFQVLLIGWDRLGRIIEHSLRESGVRYIVVDSNPDRIGELIALDIPCVFGDINNHEVLEQIDFSKIKTIFSTIPDRGDNELIVAHLKQHADINFICIVDSKSKARELYKLGVHYVLIPYELAGVQLLACHGEKGINLTLLLGDAASVRSLGTSHRSTLSQEDDFVHRRKSDVLSA